MTKRINIIFSILNMSEKKQLYKPISTLDEANDIFKNKNIDFNIDGKKYAMTYDNTKEEIELKEKTETNNLITIFNYSTSFEQIFMVFGKL